MPFLALLAYGMLALVIIGGLFIGLLIATVILWVKKRKKPAIILSVITGIFVVLLVAVIAFMKFWGVI